MGKIVVSANVTLDGVVQDPTGEEGFTHGGWFAQIGDKDREGWAKDGLDAALGADASLLARRSYEFLDRRVTPGAISRADAAGTSGCSFNGGNQA